MRRPRRSRGRKAVDSGYKDELDGLARDALALLRRFRGVQQKINRIAGPRDYTLIDIVDELETMIEYLRSVQKTATASGRRLKYAISKGEGQG